MRRNHERLSDSYAHKKGTFPMMLGYVFGMRDHDPRGKVILKFTLIEIATVGIDVPRNLRGTNSSLRGTKQGVLTCVA